MNLLRPVGSLNGVGSKLLSCFQNILPNTRVVDLLFHLPISSVTRHLTGDLGGVSDGSIVTIEGVVVKYKPSFNKKSPFCVVVQTNSDEVYLDFFHFKKDYLLNILPLQETRIISGKCRLYNGKIHITHPDHILKSEGFSDFIEPLYPLTKGLNHKIIKKLMVQAIDKIDIVDEWQDESYRKQQGFLDFKSCFKKIHNPENNQDYLCDSTYVRRLAYDEFLAMQVALQLMRRRNIKISGNSIGGNNKIITQFIENLPFGLTDSQNKVIAEILKDQLSPQKMTRLIQGDVGCGKTVIAAIAMMNAISSGYQVALMAPTSILAKQHFDSLKADFEKMNVSIELFTGNIKGKKRTQLLDRIKNGKVNIVIGTHALFYDAIIFDKLGLVVIDEQHRFGVKQRLKLVEKGYQCDFLSMSATPIPRTLALTIYGDMEVSTIDEKPLGRKSIDTRVLSSNKFDKVIEAIKRALDNNEKIYWICPLVDESEILSFAAVEDRYQDFKRIFGEDIVGMVHGKMPQEEKDLILADFYDGKYKLLLATTVVEVGVNVPDATIMIIENANKFGLAQLHQLRGRVGRGVRQGVCILLYNSNEISNTSLERLKVIRDTSDGFLIAEKDLQIRGGGDIMGIKQSGIPEFKIANLKYHYDLLKSATQDAKLLLNKDPDLTSKRGLAIQLLLQIFDYEDPLVGL